MKHKHKKLEQYLKDINQTQYAFAKVVGVNKVTVHGWLYGKRKPQPEMIKVLHEVTGGYLSWDDFYGDEAMYG